MNKRMKPWQRLEDRCGRCSSLATYFAYPTGDPMVDIGAGKVDLYPGGQLQGSVGQMLCDVHLAQALDELCDAFGSSSADLLRSRWWFWFAYESRMGRHLGKALHALDEWRWDRGLEGKRFGHKLIRCSTGEPLHPDR